ncbi:DNA-directed RNA polymerase subunit alpha [Mycoplasma sp. CSL7503-lung]|uniref:DNA-directed RNA polymerase subunit alpha n=1 Tax=Mycoplasma sp. CSL7503-lung TaxID=536372 RepID=UPI0021D2B546|nr:DNA-directed RNA polymerase subunit alpha [Mycoplasma sp. CSL7503-lung]MCU4706380.1 DNA-directed RNA polymerase subunit alpha [Mycoplasma sp. CSL7503-lung]
MEKMKPLSYRKKPEFRVVSDNEVTFILEGLERGFGKTLGVALRRMILSSMPTLAPFSVRIEGAEFHYKALKDVTEDVLSLIMNLREVNFTYSPSYVADDEIVKVKLKSNEIGQITAKSMEVSNPSVQIINPNQYIATVNSPDALNLELFLRVGRGFMSEEENKNYINDKDLKSKLETDIKRAEFLAVDSNFAPIKTVTWDVKELNSDSTKIEEALEFKVVTNGSITAKEAVKYASEMLIGLFRVIGGVENMEDVQIFEEPKIEEPQQIEDDLDITQLGLSVRSLNALKKSGKKKLSQVAEMRFEELEGIKNLGKKSVQEIIEKLEEHGLQLKEGEE